MQNLDLSATGASQRNRFDKPENIANHYDIMAQLDKDVHGNERLSMMEVMAAINLLGHVPERVFLPAFGTARHVKYLLQMGVKHITGVDLSPACVALALEEWGDDSRVELIVGDLTKWENPGDPFDASILLGNSFADATDHQILAAVTAGMVRPLREGGIFLMDYIGEGYLSRCNGQSVEWQAEYNGVHIIDRRTPSFNPETRIMTIDVQGIPADQPDAEPIVKTQYQKLILDNDAVQVHFIQYGKVHLVNAGKATAVNQYYKGAEGELGMIARAEWWVGPKYK